MAGKSGLAFRDCIADINWGAHLCSIYRNKKEQMSVALPYVLAGLQNNDRCIYITDKQGREDIRQALSGSGIDVEACVEKKQLFILGKEETYLREGFFSPVATLDMFLNAHYEALRDGFKGLRASGDLNLTNAERDFSVLNRLIDYEREVNFLFWHNHLIGLCQYNETTVPESILSGVIATHPRVVLYGKLYENPFYVPAHVSGRPDKDAEEKPPQQDYRKLRDTLIRVDSSDNIQNE